MILKSCGSHYYPATGQGMLHRDPRGAKIGRKMPGPDVQFAEADGFTGRDHESPDRAGTGFTLGLGHRADHLWRRLDADLWEPTHIPGRCSRTVSTQTIRQALADPAFRAEVDQVVNDRRAALDTPAWFDLNHARSPLRQVAYFSMEFMLSEALPIYSGGLGNVAGDQLKSASDLGVPVIGIGLLYSQGYFRQIIDRAGGQQALYPYNSPDQLPITPPAHLRR